MAGSKFGALKAKNTIYKKYGKDYFKNIGAIGGSRGHTGGFASNPALARLAGEKGGRISKRGKAKNENKSL